MKYRPHQQASEPPMTTPSMTALTGQVTNTASHHSACNWTKSLSFWNDIWMWHRRTFSEWQQEVTQKNVFWMTSGGDTEERFLNDIRRWHRRIFFYLPSISSTVHILFGFVFSCPADGTECRLCWRALALCAWCPRSTNSLLCWCRVFVVPQSTWHLCAWQHS